LQRIIKFILFALCLLGQVILAGLQAARLVLSPNLQLQPVLVTFNPGIKSDFLKAVLANSLTLSPGTLTVSVEGEKFTVHALNLSAAQRIVQWPLLNLLRGMEEDNV
jgi:multicomponent Na+:H+ antiporter subunit E